METTATKNENDRPAPALGNEGNGSTVGTDFEQPKIRTCPHRYAGCISQNGYLCLHDKSCEPIDAAGRRFSVSYSVEDGQTYMIRTYVRKAPGSILDADTLQATATMRGAEAAIASTPFVDVEPFNPAKFCQDVIGS